MSDEPEGPMLNIYVLPSEENVPPRAMLFEEAAVEIEVEGIKILGCKGALATWSNDIGTWALDGMPVPSELAEAITEHARNLGVDL